MARNLYGIIPIKVRAKDTTTIDLSSISIDDLEVKGTFASAKGGKLILLDLFIEDAGGDYIYYNGITTLNEDGFAKVIGVDASAPVAILISMNDENFSIDGI